MKERTSLAIDAHLRRAAEAAARKRGISLSRLVTEAIEAHLAPRRKNRFPVSEVLKTGKRKWLARDHEKLAFRD